MIDRVLRPPPIGVFGGTFDPVHVGHLRLAVEAYEILNLSAVRIIPLNEPNHRDSPIVSAERRIEMLSSAIDGKRLVADDRELRRGGVSYTIESLEELRKEFTEHPLHLLIGADAFHHLCGWHRWQDLLRFSHLVIVARPDSDAVLDPRLQQLLDSVRVTDPDILRNELYGRIYFQPIPLLPISSTDIRERIGGGRDISYLVPPSVQRLIEQHRLYKSSDRYER
jgi:nicotinate-nucleotide adenylyltransferase